MNPRPLLLALIGAGVLAFAAALPGFLAAPTPQRTFFFEVTLSSDTAGRMQLFYDVGRSFNEKDSSLADVPGDGDAHIYRLPLPAGIYRGMRFDPIDREGRISFSQVRIVDGRNRELHRFALSDFRPLQQIAAWSTDGPRATFVAAPGANDPNFDVRLGTVLWLRASAVDAARRFALPFAAWWIGFASVFLLSLTRRAREWTDRAGAALCSRPRRAIVLTAVLAVAWQCHPVIFGGRSFVSPNNGALMLYERFPTVPGYADSALLDTRGSDVGAMLFQHMHYAALEHDALFRDRELPLWNRYNLAGGPLLGQGQSMFGDPLHMIPLLANAASWAWDAKFVIARLLWALGTGAAVWLLTRHLPATLLLTAASPFIGFFSFRLNHPAGFSLCYAPWIFVGWLLLTQAESSRGVLRSLGVMMAATWCVFTSGTVKEAYMLVACLHWAGLVYLVLHTPSRRGLGWRIGAAGAAGLLMLLLSAPLWSSFLHALKSSYSAYENPAAAQIKPWLAAGFFDDLFYRQCFSNENQQYPASNFVVLAGLLWLGATGLGRGRARTTLALVLGALPPAAMAFGLLPENVIIQLPFLANIIHVDNTFSCPLILLAAVGAGLGFERLWQAGKFFLADYLGYVVALAGLLGLYFGSTQAVAKSDFFVGYAPAVVIAALALPVAIGLGRSAGRAFVLVAVLASASLGLWRFGQFAETRFSGYVFTPRPRVDLDAASSAVGQVNSLTRSPARVVGLGGNLYPGFNQRLRWESPYGVDAIRNRAYYDLATTFGLERVWVWDHHNSPAELPTLVPIHDLLNIRFYLATPDATPRSLPPLSLTAREDLLVFESPTAWPRAFWVDRILPYRDLRDLKPALATAAGRPFAAVREADVASANLASLRQPNSERRTTAASRYRLTTNTSTFAVHAPGPGVAVLTEAYYPDDFEVYLNGEQVNYFRVNHAFKGVFIPRAGDYEVSFRYWPAGLTRSLWLAALGAIMTVAAGWFGRRLADAHWRD